jgi:hypothetical protein
MRASTVLVLVPLLTACGSGDWHVGERRIVPGEVRGFVGVLVEPGSRASITESVLLADVSSVTVLQEVGEDALFVTLSFPSGLDTFDEGGAGEVEVSVLGRIDDEWFEQPPPEALEIEVLSRAAFVDVVVHTEGETVVRTSRRTERLRFEASVFWPSRQEMLTIPFEYVRISSHRWRPPPPPRDHYYDC